MSLAVDRFSSNVLSSFDNARRFLDGHVAIAKIASKKDANLSFSNIPVPHKPILGYTWTILQTVTYPLRLIAELFFTALSLIFPGAYTLAQHCSIGFDIYDENRTKVLLLQKTINCPQQGMEDLTAHPPIALNTLTDPRIKKRTFRKPLRFDHTKGICRGMTQWFNYLYLQTKHLYANPRDHMLALGKVFAEGGPREAVLLQSLFIKKGKLLNVRIGALHDRRTIVAAQTIELKRAVNPLQLCVAHPQTAIHHIESLPAGTYETWFPVHACSYIKVSPQLSYFFDSNDGVHEIAGPEQGAGLLEFFDSFYMGSNPTRKVEFHPVQLRPGAYFYP